MSESVAASPHNAALAPALGRLGLDVHVFLINGRSGAHDRRRRLRDPPGAGPRTLRGAVADRSRPRRPLRLARSGPFDAIVAADWRGDASMLSRAQRHRTVTHLHTCGAVFNEISGIPAEGQAGAAGFCSASSAGRPRRRRDRVVQPRTARADARAHGHREQADGHCA